MSEHHYTPMSTFVTMPRNGRNSEIMIRFGNGDSCSEVVESWRAFFITKIKTHGDWPADYNKWVLESDNVIYVSSSSTAINGRSFTDLLVLMTRNGFTGRTLESGMLMFTPLSESKIPTVVRGTDV